jgi:hypothetical protein
MFPSLEESEPVRMRSLVPVVLYLVFLGGIVFAVSTGVVMPS